ncbi:Uncharacterized membrane protein [Rhizobiales bacterium GAS188]|nr:Uncharacterized membrane protein [Rhizobiales bacterium GAS188]
MDGYLLVGAIVLLLGPIAFFVALVARARASGLVREVERLRERVTALSNRVGELEKRPASQEAPATQEAPASQEAQVTPLAPAATAQPMRTSASSPEAQRLVELPPESAADRAAPITEDVSSLVAARAESAIAAEPPREIAQAAAAPFQAIPAPIEAVSIEAGSIEGWDDETVASRAATVSAQIGPPPPAPPPSASTPSAMSRGRNIEERLGAHWAVWVGGIALALGVILLVRASIERGYFGPGVRLALGALMAIGLVVAGEFLRRRESNGDASAPTPGPFGAPYIPGVLTAAGTIAAFATIYAAHAVYGFIGPTTSFLALGVVGLVTMAAAALHGPALAGLGLVGALATPLLVVSHSINPWPVIIYDLVVIATAYILARLKGWLWLALAAASGGALWGLAFIAGIAQSGGRQFLQASLVHISVQTGLAAYALAIDRHRGRDDLSARLDPVAHAVLGVFAGVAILALALGASPFFGLGWIAGALLITALLVGTGLRSASAAGAAAMGSLVTLAALCLWPSFPAFGPSQTVAVLNAGALHIIAPPSQVEALLQGVPPIEPLWYAAFAVAACLLIAMATGRRLLAGPDLGLPIAAVYAGVASLPPLAGLAIAYLRFAPHEPSLILAACGLILGLGFAAASRLFMEAYDSELSASLKLGLGAVASSAIAAFALGLVFALDGGMLTVALALAALGTAIVAVRLDIAPLRWCIVALGILVAARLAYDPRIVGSSLGRTPIFNWLLFGYGVPAAAFAIAGRLLRQQGQDTSSRVADALGVLFAALLFFFEIRHAMNGGDPFARGSGLIEQGLLSAVAFGFALVLTRLDASRSNIVFRLASLAAGAIGLLDAAVSLGLRYNPLLEAAPLEGGPLVNALLLGYLIPGVMAGQLAVFARKVRPLWYWAGAAWLGLLLVLAFIILEVRVLFHGQVVIASLGAGISELGIDAAICLAAAIVCVQQLSENSGAPGFFRLAAFATGAAAAAIAVLGLGLVENPLLDSTPIAGGRLFNALIIGYLLPAAAAGILAYGSRNIGEPRLCIGATLLSAMLALAFLVLEVRVLFHGQVIVASLGAGIAELGCYTGLCIVGATLFTTQVRAIIGEWAPILSACLAVAAALLAVLGLALFANPLFRDAETVTRPLLNSLLVGYALPCALSAVLARRARSVNWMAIAVSASIGAIMFLFAYASLEIRRLFQGPAMSLINGFTQGEVYAYSVGWSVLGILLLAYGIWRGSREARLASACFVVAAALKVFLIDLAGLEGILRAVSFIGLGFVLIGIGLVYQKLVFARPNTTSPEAVVRAD